MQLREALAGLFSTHGTPRLLKTDNSCSLIVEVTQACLSLHAVEALYSPPFSPRYNGSIEAGIGAMKMRTEQEVSRHGQVGQWTYQDGAAAQALANATSRPRRRRPEILRALWAIDVPEHIGTPVARRCLQKMAHGAADARPTRDAKAALQRLMKHRDENTRCLRSLEP